MNFRSTTFLFGLLLGMLWLFGLMVAWKKTAVDPSFLMPTLQAGGQDIEVDSITIKRRIKGKEPEEFHFEKKGEDWMLSVPGIKQTVKLDKFKINEIVRHVKDARRNEEADVSTDLAKYELDQPLTVV